MDYEEYMEQFYNEDGGEILDYDPALFSANLSPQQQETLDNLESQRNDSATQQFYEKYGLTPPESGSDGTGE